MKVLDVFAWSEVAQDLLYEGPSRSLVVRSSMPAPVFVTQEGYEVLAGVGTEVECKVSGAYSFRVAGPKGCRSFFLGDKSPGMASEGLVYTNPDRMAHQSGAYDEVKRLLRKQQLEHRAALSEMRRETAALKAARAAAIAAAAPAPAPAPAPEADGDAADA